MSSGAGRTCPSRSSNAPRSRSDAMSLPSGRQILCCHVPEARRRSVSRLEIECVVMRSLMSMPPGDGGNKTAEVQDARWALGSTSRVPKFRGSHVIPRFS